MKNTNPFQSPNAAWCGRRPNDPRPIIYFGADAATARILQDAGLSNFALSYSTVARSQSKTGTGILTHPGLTDSRCRCILDSGAYRFLPPYNKAFASGRPIEAEVETYIRNYAAWVKEHGQRFDFYITFDYRVWAETTFRMTHRLREMGIRPVPVYHGDSSIDWFMRYVDLGYSLICISGRFFPNDRTGLLNYYDAVFDISEKHRVALHGLACAEQDTFRYPWYSVDWASLARDSGKLTWWDEHGQQVNVQVSARTIRPDIKNRLSEALRPRLDSCHLTMDEVIHDRQKRRLFNAVMLKQFVDSRRPTVRILRRTLF